MTTTKITATILTIFLVATAVAQPEQQEQSQTQQATITQGNNKENTGELKEQPRQLTGKQQNPVDNTELKELIRQQVAESVPEWIKLFMWFASVIVAIFTALIAFFGVYSILHSAEFKKEAEKLLNRIDKHLEAAKGAKKEMEELLEQAQKTKAKQDEITAEMIKNQNFTKEEADKIAADSKNPIDEAIAEARGYQDKEMYEKAIEKWKAIANLTENKNKEKSAQAYVYAAYLTQEHYDAEDEDTHRNVVLLYDKALEIDPDCGDEMVYHNRGSAKLELGNYESAKVDAKEALKIKPDDEDAKQLLADIEEKLKGNK